jgi:uncharacterized protein YlxP (DUF503 family)
MTIGILYLHLFFVSCKSLKEKRSQLKPFLHRIHREFNVSISEMDLQDKWTESIVAISQICNDQKITQSELNAVIQFTKNHFRNIEIQENHIEIL